MTKKEIPAYVCSHVFEGVLPILLVCKEDDEWQFLCGGEHDLNEHPRVVGLNHILERDKSLLEVMNLENNQEAERNKVGGKWEVSQF